MTAKIETAFENFLAGVAAMVAEHCAKETPTLKPTTIGFTTGRRYWRVYKDLFGSETHRSAYCFVCRETGAVLKPATWKAPAKGARSNVLDPDHGLSGVGRYGAHSLLR